MPLLRSLFGAANLASLIWVMAHDVTGVWPVYVVSYFGIIGSEVYMIMQRRKAK